MSKVKDLSVWQWPYRKKYYLTHPWKWISQLFLNIGDAKDRARYGYCRTDWYDFDNWFTTISPMMLREMAEKGNGYPGRPPFDTSEKWHSWLNRMADQLEKCKFDFVNLSSTVTLEEYEVEHDKLVKETFAELAKHWDCLWD